MNIELTEQMKHCRDFFKDLSPKTYFVGGCIRDIVMKQIPHDYDLITDKEPDEIKAYMKSKGKRCYLTGARYGTMSCKIGPDNEMTEITTFRKEVYDGVSRKPKTEYTKSLEEDLKRRDFTINTLAADMDGNVKDLMGGLGDIKDGILKCVGHPKQRYREDPLRILRAIRFSNKYGFKYEEITKKRLIDTRFSLLRISKERIIDELNKIFLLKPESVEIALWDLWILNIWQVVLPELHLQLNFNQNSPHHDFALHKHSINVVMGIKNEPIFREDLNCIWSALLHDIAKPFVQTLHKSGERCNYVRHETLGAEMVNNFCIKYKFSNKDRRFIVDSVRNHLKIECWLKPFDDGGKRK